MKLWKFLKNRMKHYNAKEAFSDGQTYAELILQIEERANKIKSKGKLIIVSEKDKKQQAIEILTVIASGTTAVPLAYEYGETYFRQIRSRIMGKSAGRNVPIVLFTSGSRGVPKGVMLTNNNIIQNILGITDYFNVYDSKNILILRPLAHSSSIVGELFFALCNGIKLDFYNEPFVPKRVLSYMLRFNTGSVGMTPSMAKLLARISNGKDEYPRVISLSGEILDEKDAVEINKSFPYTAIYNVYGLTENSPRATALLPEFFKLKPGSVGKPIRKTKVKIVNDELYIKSRSIMKGYLEDKYLSQEKMSRGWLKTGDMARCDDDGFYYILGRADDMIIRCGINIYPAEIEKLLKQDNMISEVYCYAVCDKFGGQSFCVEVVPANGYQVDESDIRQTSIRLLPSYIPLTQIKIVPHLTHTVTGKTIKNKNLEEC